MIISILNDKKQEDGIKVSFLPKRIKRIICARFVIICTLNNGFHHLNFSTGSQFFHKFGHIRVQFMFLTEVNPEFGSYNEAEPTIRSVFTIHHQRDDVFA